MATNPENWRRIEAILDDALDLPAEERPAFLDRACAGDSELRAEVEGLLAAEERAGNLLETPAAEYAATLLKTAAGLEGRELGPYRLRQRIGSGGMGVVYAARDTRLGRLVAVKLLPPEWSRDAGAKERFLREARAASALDHPNICTIHDIGELDEGTDRAQLFLVMAYYRGETLAERIQRGSLPAEEARELIVQVARGLERAHQEGIVHRDVKPANVMIAEDETATRSRPGQSRPGRATPGRANEGRAKILDFGIAKIAGEAGLTRTGSSLGTPYYMSPEQASGRSVDGRTDIWSLGVMLYEMLTGRRPFAGDDARAVIYGILHREPEPMAEAPADLVRVVAKTLAKDPGERYQSVAELIADLEDGAPAAVAVSSGRRRRPLAAAAVAAAVLVGLAGWWSFRDTPLEPSEPEPQPASGDASGATAGGGGMPVKLAVFYFQNLRGDPEIEWLRQGIAEMLVTELRQSPDLDVLGTSRLYRTLADLDALEQQPLVPATVREVAERHDRGVVLQGSFFRQGQQCRIAYRLDEAATERSLLSDQLIAPAGPNCFLNLVDNLSFDVRERFETDEGRSSVLDFAASPLAWRRYVEGQVFFYESKDDEAIAKWTEAVELDPGFALAWSNLGTVHGNLGQHAAEREYLGRAVELADRLPLRESFTVRASYYNASWATLDRSIEIYEEGLALYPDRTPWRNNLAVNYALREKYEEALSEFEKSIAAGTTFSGAFISAAVVATALDRLERGYEILAAFADRHPDDWKLQNGLGGHLVRWSRFEEAEERLRRAVELLGSDHWRVLSNLWQLHALREDWPNAAVAAVRLDRLDDAYGRSLSAVVKAHSALFSGQSAEALRHFDDAVRRNPQDGKQVALIHTWRSRSFLQRGEAAAALAAAKEADRLAPDDWPGLRALFLIALAEQELGSAGGADQAVAKLRALWEERPNVVEERQLHQLTGLLALARGNAETARAKLGRAAELLPKQGVEIYSVYPQHVAIRFALAEAALAAGDDDGARRWLERVVAAGPERLTDPVPWVRAGFLLSQLLERHGETAAAHRQLELFLRRWQNGDLDRARIEQARAALASVASD